MPHRVPKDIRELCDRKRTHFAWHAELIQPDITGGKTSVADIAALNLRPSVTTITVSGLDQAAFEALVEVHGAQLHAIHLWKCPRVADLTPLEAMPHLELAAFYWNQQATRLWDFSRTPQLRGLQFEDFRKLHDLGDLSTATSLHELEFGDAYSSGAVFRSLEPLGGLSNLRSLSFAAKRIEADGLRPLANLLDLEHIQFPSNQFTTEQVAWLRARLPGTVRGESLEPIWRLSGGIGSCDVIIVGKRKPMLNSRKDAARIARYESKFRELVEQYQANPSLEPGSGAA